MIKFLLFLCLLASGLFVKGQESQTMWVDGNFKPVLQSNAAYKKVLTMHDTVMTIDLISLTDNMHYVEHYCKGHPIGKWKEMKGKRVIEERNFDNITYITDTVKATTDQIPADSVNEVSPSFAGGDVGRIQFLIYNTEYPAIARIHGLQGMTYVTFIVTKEGNIDSVAVLKSSNPYLDYEAVRVVRTMPKWNPGTKDGIPVNVQFNMPMKFTLAN